MLRILLFFISTILCWSPVAQATEVTVVCYQGNLEVKAPVQAIINGRMFYGSYLDRATAHLDAEKYGLCVEDGGINITTRDAKRPAVATGWHALPGYSLWARELRAELSKDPRDNIKGVLLCSLLPSHEAPILNVYDRITEKTPPGGRSTCCSHYFKYSVSYAHLLVPTSPRRKVASDT